MGDGPIYWNRPFNVKFLDATLRVKDASNILQENLFTVLTSVGMIATSHFFSILHLGIRLPFRWLTGNTHKLAHRNWGPRSMGRAMDLIYDACQDILADNSLIYDEAFMLHIFDELAEEIPEFKAHLEYEFENKTTEFIEVSESKPVPYKELIKELFSPTDADNQDSTKVLEKITATGIQAMVDELVDESKASYKYLSISGSEFLYKHCPEDVKKAMLGKMASNDLAKSSFAGVTAQIQCFGRVGMSAAAAVSDTARNGFFVSWRNGKAYQSEA